MSLSSDFTYVDWINKRIKGKEEYVERIEYYKTCRVDEDYLYDKMKVLYKFRLDMFGPAEVLEHDLKLILKKDGKKNRITINGRWLNCLIYITT